MATRKHVVISGGTHGLGRAIAERLAPEHDVTILSRNKQQVAAAAKELDCRGVACDVSDFTQVAKAMTEITAAQPQIDWLVNVAGTWVGRKLGEYSKEDIQKEVGVNLLGVVHLTQATLPHLADDAPHILTVVSAAGLKPEGHATVYAASKSGAAGFVRAARAELAGKAAVSALYPVAMAEVADGKQSSYAVVASIAIETLRAGKSVDVTKFPIS